MTTEHKIQLLELIIKTYEAFLDDEKRKDLNQSSLWVKRMNEKDRQGLGLCEVAYYLNNQGEIDLDEEKWFVDLVHKENTGKFFYQIHYPGVFTMDDLIEELEDNDDESTEENIAELVRAEYYLWAKGDYESRRKWLKATIKRYRDFHLINN